MRILQHAMRLRFARTRMQQLPARAPLREVSQVFLPAFIVVRLLLQQLIALHTSGTGRLQTLLAHAIGDSACCKPACHESQAFQVRLQVPIRLVGIGVLVELEDV